jgi:hydroxymethylglutaryl-CoA synthase
MCPVEHESIFRCRKRIVSSFVQSGQIRYGLAVGSDTAQARPGDALEYTAAAGAAAFVIGNEKDENALCRIDRTISFTTDTPDFWRPAEASFPQHAGRFTGEPGYFHHVRETVKGMLEMETESRTFYYSARESVAPRPAENT